MSFDTYEIKIVFSTNIRTNPTIEFKRSLLVGGKGEPLGLNEYPYFTNDVKYSANQLRQMSWVERLDFFFNKTTFNERLGQYADMDDYLKKDADDYFENRDTIIQHNVKTMLEVLFPTKFPVINDLHTSYDMFTNSDSFNGTFFNETLLNPTFEKYFSYLKPGGQIYTFKRLIWLNDVFNHPRYNELIDRCNQLRVWARDAEKSIDTDIQTKLTAFTGEYSGAIQEFEKLLSELSLKITEKAPGVTQKYDQVHFQKIMANMKRVWKRVRSANSAFGNQSATPSGIKSLFASFLENESGQRRGASVTEAEWESYINDAGIDAEDLPFVEFEEYKRKMQEPVEDKTIKQKSLILEKLKESIDTLVREFKFPTRSGKYVSPFTGKGDVPANNIGGINGIGGKLLNEEFKQEYKAIESRIQKLSLQIEPNKRSNMDSLFQKKEAVVSENYKNSKAFLDEYFNFTGFLRNYRRPIRESTNKKLQDIINWETDESVAKFFEIFAELYNYRANKIPMKQGGNDYLATGMNYINSNTATGPRREIYVLADFIEGEVTDANVGSIFCSFIGEHLGNEFEFLARTAIYRNKKNENLNWWSVSRNRMMFSLKSTGSSNSKPLEIVANPLPTSTATGVTGNYGMAAPVKVAEKDDSTARIRFSRDIVNDKDIDDMIEELNRFSTGDRLSKDKVLDYLKKNKADLHGVILKWAENELDQNQDVIQTLNKIKNNSQNEIDNAENEVERIGTPRSGTAQLKIANSTLFKAIAEKLLTNEKAKRLTRAVGGKSRRLGRKKSRRTKKRNRT
jgi:hypothetical protein